MKVFTALNLILCILSNVHAFHSVGPRGAVAVKRSSRILPKSPPAFSSSWHQSKGIHSSTSLRVDMKESSTQITRVSWLSWWSQVILTTVSTVILLFAKSVERTAKTSAGTPSFILSAVGVLLSGASIIWTWGNGARLSQRIIRKPTAPPKAAEMLRRAIRIGVTLNLTGLLLGLVAAENIVGNLAIKVLTARQFGSGGIVTSSVEGLQPLDVLVVQANTNILLSHFCSLVAFLYLTKVVQKLASPSSSNK